MKKIIGITVTALGLLLIVCIAFCSPLFQKPNNDILYVQSVTRYCSEEDIFELKNCFEEGKLSLSVFLMKYRPQCIRQTINDGRYALLLGDNNTRVFVCWSDTTRKIYNVIIIKQFLENKDFKSLNIGESEYSDILKMDGNSIDISKADEPITGHITSDGVTILKYNVVLESGTPKYLVKSIDCYSNEDVSEMIRSNPFMSLLYLLPQDKAN